MYHTRYGRYVRTSFEQCHERIECVRSEILIIVRQESTGVEIVGVCVCAVHAVTHVPVEWDVCGASSGVGGRHSRYPIRDSDNIHAPMHAPGPAAGLRHDSSPRIGITCKYENSPALRTDYRTATALYGACPVARSRAVGNPTVRYIHATALLHTNSPK